MSATVLAQSDLETCTLRTNNQSGAGSDEQYEETLDCDNKLVLLLSIESKKAFGAESLSFELSDVKDPVTGA